MKTHRTLSIVLTTALFSLCLSTNIYAMNTGFSTKEMNPVEADSFIDNIDLSLTEKPNQSSVTCFDVNEAGRIAVGFPGTSEDAWVSVYSTEGSFLYGYHFNCSGDIGVEWSDDTHLMLYFVRGDVVALVDEGGRISEVRSIDNTSANNSYWNHTVNAKERTVGDVRYEIKNQLGWIHLPFGSSYSQITKTDPDGTVTVIYDVSGEKLVQTALFLLAAIGIVVVAVLILIKTVRNGSSHSNPVDAN